MTKRITAILAAVTLFAASVTVAILVDGSGRSTVAQDDAPDFAELTDAFTPEETAAIIQLIEAYIAANPGFVRDYIMSDPDVIRDAVTELERRRLEDEASRQAEAIAENRDLLVSSDLNAVLGNPDGDVTLVEFFDYNCSYCRRALDDMNRLLDEDPGLRIVLKEFPVLGAGSTEAAQVAAAVNIIAPEAYPRFHRLLLGSSSQATGEAAIAAAVEAGVEEQLLRITMQTPGAIAHIEEAYQIADALGINGTPTYVLGNEVIVGAVGYDALRQMIDSVRNCGQTVC